MKILLRRSGGFAGVAMECAVATDELPPPERRELETLLDRAHPEALRSDLSGEGFDLLRYDLSIDGGDRSITLSFDDGTLPDRLVPLIEWLAERLGPVR